MSVVLCLERFPMNIENCHIWHIWGRRKDTSGRHTNNTCTPHKLEGYSCCLTGTTLPLVLGVWQRCSRQNWPVSHESYCRIPSLRRLVTGIFNLAEVVEIIMSTLDGFLEGIKLLLIWLLHLMGGVLILFFNTYALQEISRFYTELGPSHS